jgi:hypothetical protein
MARARRYRSAISGRFVRRSTAKRNPRTTIAERCEHGSAEAVGGGNEGGAGASRARWGKARARLALG